MKIPKRTNILIGLLIAFIGVVIFLLLKDSVFSMFSIEEIQRYVSSFGAFAPVIYIILLTVAIIISYIPNIPLAVASGILFGPFLGGIYSLIAGVIGGLANFYIARTLGVSFIKKLFGKTIHFYEYDEKFLGWIIFISRLFPFFSFDIISYGAGLTNIRMRTFLIATFFGMIPMTFLFTYLGGAILVDRTMTIVISVLLVLLFLIAPWIIKKYNIFGLKDKIRLK